jgi:hypothetical protein
MDSLESLLYSSPERMGSLEFPASPERPVSAPPVSPPVPSAGELMLDSFLVVVVVIAGIVLLFMLFGKKGAPVAVAAAGKAAAAFSPWFPVR